MKPSVRFVLVVLCVMLSAPATAGLVSFDVHQTDFVMGDYSQANSDWGLVKITYDWSAGEQLQYFNLVVDGRWEVQNAPLFTSSLSSSRNISINFSLGNVVGSPVERVQCLATVGTDWLMSMPSGPPAEVSVSKYAVTVGGVGNPGPISSASSWTGGKVADEAHNWGMPNQDCDVSECVPAAFSNSLQWLNRKHPSLNIPPDKMSIEGLKGPTRWEPPRVDSKGYPIPGTGGCPPGHWQGKGDALKDYVTTRMFAPNELSKVFQEMKAGQDIELVGRRHVAVVESIAVNEDGTYTLEISHDIQQGMPGGTTTQPLRIDPTTGKLLNSAYGFEKDESIYGFVVECPVIPEPMFLQLGMLAGLGGLGMLRMRRRN
ncbi:MAG: hypothetical protein KatS3mg024_1434 [Armatimonadota bacterium]|nr:MAG: hypothetical protein KatS3mg024_1434 [Armatimonadota bacterium]